MALGLELSEGWIRVGDSQNMVVCRVLDSVFLSSTLIRVSCEEGLALLSNYVKFVNFDASL